MGRESNPRMKVHVFFGRGDVPPGGAEDVLGCMVKKTLQHFRRGKRKRGGHWARAAEKRFSLIAFAAQQ